MWYRSLGVDPADYMWYRSLGVDPADYMVYAIRVGGRPIGHVSHIPGRGVRLGFLYSIISLK